VLEVHFLLTTNKWPPSFQLDYFFKKPDSAYMTIPKTFTTQTKNFP